MYTTDHTTTPRGRHRRGLRVLTAVLLACALLAAACGGSDEDGSDAASDATESSTSAETGSSDPGDSDSGDPDSDSDSGDSDDSGDNDGATDGAGDPPATDGSDAGAVLRFGRNDITSLDPHKASVGPDVEILFITYDRLVHTAPDGSLEPGLAESWEFSDDALTLTLHVREGVTFHDGEALDAEAVKASLDRARTVEGSAVAGELAPIEEVTVVDPMTVEVALSAPTGNLPALLSDRAGAIISPAALENPDLDVNPVGAGMYAMTDYAPGSGATFVAYEDYWDPAAQGLAGIEWTVFGEAAAMVNALRADQIDVAALAPSAVDTARSDGLQIIAGPTRQVYYLNLNETRPGLDDVRVRRAIAHAIDRNGIVQALFFGEAEATSQLFPQGEAGHDSDIAPDAFAYDLELAAELLAEAGYGPGDLSYDLISFPSSPVPEINEVIAAGLSQIGIDVNIVVVDVTDVAQTFFIEAEGDMMQGAWSGRPSAEQTIQLLHTSTGFGNPGGYAPDGYDELFAETTAATTPEERAAGLTELARIGYDEVLSVPIVFPFSPLGAQERVQGLERYVTGKQEFRGVTIADS